MDSQIIIDAHCHIFPDKIAKKAAKSIGEFYDIPMRHIGSSEELIASGKQIGVVKYLVCSTATKPDQVESINNFIKSECDIHPEFIGFGTLHPHMDDLEKEIGRIIEMGLHGIKLHPDFQGFAIDDDEVGDIYKLAQGKLPILIHMGDDRYDGSDPIRLVKICEKYPDLKIMAAHFGGYQKWDVAECYLKGYKNLRFDTSSTLAIIGPERGYELMKSLGISNFFFGTDFPMWDHKEEYDRFMQIQLSKEEREAVFYKNFLEFMDIPL